CLLESRSQSQKPRASGAPAVRQPRWRSRGSAADARTSLDAASSTRDHAGPVGPGSHLSPDRRPHAPGDCRAVGLFAAPCWRFARAPQSVGAGGGGILMFTLPVGLTNEGHISDLKFDQWQAGELSAEQVASLEQHLSDCDRCRGRRTEVEAQAWAFLERYPELEARSKRARPARARVRRAMGGWE